VLVAGRRQLLIEQSKPYLNHRRKAYHRY
jgi:hypothetical protein